MIIHYLIPPRHEQRAWYTLSLGSFDLKEPFFGQRGPCVDQEVLFWLYRALYELERTLFGSKRALFGLRVLCISLKGVCMGRRRALSSHLSALSDQQRPFFCLQETSISLRRPVLAWEAACQPERALLSQQRALSYLATRGPLSA